MTRWTLTFGTPRHMWIMRLRRDSDSSIWLPPLKKMRERCERRAPHLVKLHALLCRLPGSMNITLWTLHPRLLPQLLIVSPDRSCLKRPSRGKAIRLQQEAAYGTGLTRSKGAWMSCWHNFLMAQGIGKPCYNRSAMIIQRRFQVVYNFSCHERRSQSSSDSCSRPEALSQDDEPCRRQYRNLGTFASIFSRLFTTGSTVGL